ncbi:hypothetical protein GCM10028804_02780 [Larkinella terrae]
MEITVVESAFDIDQRQQTHHNPGRQSDDINEGKQFMFPEISKSDEDVITKHASNE